MKRMLAILWAVALMIPSVLYLAENTAVSDKEAIEYALNLAHNPDQEFQGL